jgi:hypothetical protein
MRILRLLIILIVILAALLFAAQVAESWRYVMPATSGQLLYVATFDGFTDEWRLYDGRLSTEIVDESLRITVNQVQSGPYSETQQHFGDFDLRVDATSVEGPLNNAYGVIFRLRDRESYYLFLVSSDGYYRVTRRVNGDDHILSNWIRTPLIQQGIGVTNHLRVVARGNRFAFFINDQRVQLCIPDDPAGESTYLNLREECVRGSMQDTLVDSSIATGQIGLIAQTLDEPGVIVDFDNLIVYGPELEP